MHPQKQNDAAGIITTTEELLDNTGAFADTVIGSSHAKVLLVPGRSGQMSLLHRRFGAKSVEGLSLIFAQGNFRANVTCKIIPR